MNYVRPAQVAGYFYPSNPDKLRKDINLLLDVTKPKEKFEKIFGLVAPHAGYVYSGKTAAHAYNLLVGKNYKRVVVISPSHSEYFPGICVFEGDAYETPLGLLKVDKEFREKLLTVQLPFLQLVLKDFKIVPVVMGDQSKRNIDLLANKLAEVTDDETLIVASSDLSHFYSKSQADRLDSVVEKRVREFDFDSLQYDLDNHTCEACGGGPIVALMKAAKLKNIPHSMVLSRTDSGDVTGDNSEVVGYLSAVFYGD
ncbi:MAG: AmmeMemoRadiSam system protein B [Ignavibacteriaceae bacterium]|nr:AmmeMemoRadiSam system protein B [Ignavibacteriaceae bacterium]